MQILVFSDSHHVTSLMEKSVRDLEPDLILHLGDCDSDTCILTETFPHIPLRVVRGNCDLLSKSPLLENFLIVERRVIMTHGHRYEVKSGYDSLIHMGQSARADILLFGHTHIPHYEQVDTMHVLNPGSARESCALIQIQDEKVTCKHISLSVYANL